jgi:hypothetical protein
MSSIILIDIKTKKEFDKQLRRFEQLWLRQQRQIRKLMQKI